MMLNHRRRRRSNDNTGKDTGRNVMSLNAESSHSPQTMAFLTAAELVMAAEEILKTNQNSSYKILVISDRDSFSVSKEVKKHFINSGVEINAIDLSTSGSLELQDLVASPLSEHYAHNAIFNNEETVSQGVCSRLLKVSNDVKSLNLYHSMAISDDGNNHSAGETKDLADYNIPLTPEELYSDMDKSIESHSMEYKWSPHPESESLNNDEEEEETYNNDDKKDICKYVHEECSLYANNGMCGNNPELKGMRKFCKNTCNYCE